MLLAAPLQVPFRPDENYRRNMETQRAVPAPGCSSAPVAAWIYSNFQSWKKKILQNNQSEVCGRSLTGHWTRPSEFPFENFIKFKLESRDWSSWRLLKWAAGRWSQFGSKIAGRKITGNQQEHNEWLSVGPSACTSLIGWPFSETSSGRSKLTLRWKL